MTSDEAKRIGQLSAELAIAMKALDQIALAVDLQEARRHAQDALRTIRSTEPREWEQAYLLDDLLAEQDLTKQETGLLI